MGGLIDKLNIIGGLDIIVAFVFTAFLFSLILLLKKEKTVALILSIYLSFIFIEEFVILNSTGLRIKIISTNVLIPEILFILSIALFFFLFLRSGFFKRYARSHHLKKEKVVFLNVLAAGLFASLSIKYFLPSYIGLNLGYFLQIIFVFPISFFLWLIVPMFSLFLVRRK